MNNETDSLFSGDGLIMSMEGNLLDGIPWFLRGLGLSVPPLDNDTLAVTFTVSFDDKQ